MGGDIGSQRRFVLVLSISPSAGVGGTLGESVEVEAD
jgi:hypothetical protein